MPRKPSALKKPTTPKAKAKTKSKSKGGKSFLTRIKHYPILKKAGVIALKVALFFIAASFSAVIIFKWVPPLFTPLMLLRKAEALTNNKDSEIHYDWTSIEKMDPDLALAVVASEDQNFPNHSGFDFKAIENAYKSNASGRKIRGGSTISQQVAKNMFLWPGRSFIRKGFEAYFTCLIEWIWGKKRILEVYLNIAETGPMTFGMPAAASRFFNEEPLQVSRNQAARLAAVLPNPRSFSANRPSPYIRKRTGQITLQMHLLGGKNYLSAILDGKDSKKKRTKS